MSGTDERAARIKKYRTRPRFKQALEIIDPDPERRGKCEHDVATAIWLVESAAKMSVRTPKQYRDDLRKLENRLRADIKLAERAVPPQYQARRGKDSWIGEHLKRLLEETEQAIDWTSKRVRPGSPKISHARTVAVDEAYSLLRRYGGKRRLYRDGPWHELATVLLGKEGVDLFDYLKRSPLYLVGTGKVRLEP